MIDIITQKKGEGFYPYSQEDREAAAEIQPKPIIQSQADLYRCKRNNTTLNSWLSS